MCEQQFSYFIQALERDGVIEIQFSYGTIFSPQDTE